MDFVLSGTLILPYTVLYDFYSSVREFFRQFLLTPGFFVAAHIGRTAKNQVTA